MRKKPTSKYLLLAISIAVFLMAVVYKYAFVTYKNIPEQNARAVSAMLAKETESVEPLIAELKTELENSANPTFKSLLKESQYPYYIFSNRISTRRTLFWSNNTFAPKPRDILGDFELSYLEIKRGKYVVRKEQLILDNTVFEIVIMIPLEEKFAVVNEHLKNSYNSSLFTDSNFDLAEAPLDDEFYWIKVDDQNLFSVKFGKTYSNFGETSRAFIISLLIISMLFAVLFIKKRSDEYVAERQLGLGFVFVLSCILIIRSLMLLTGFPFNFVFIDLFDPIHYASTVVNPSLGDLLLNLLSLCGLGLFLFNNLLISKRVVSAISRNKRRQYLISVLCIFLSFFWLAVHHQTMKTLNFDSQWSMDISQSLEFDYLKVISFVIFFISVVIYFLFAHVCFRIYIQYIKNKPWRLVTTLLPGSFIFIVFALALKWDFIVVAVINLAFILIISLVSLPRYVGKIQYLTFIYFFSFGLPGAVIGLYANYQYTKNNLDFNKSRLANQLLLEGDFFTEMQLIEAKQKIKDDIWIKERLVDPFASKLIIEKRIIRDYLSNLDKFDIKIYGFNARGFPIEELKGEDNYHDIKSRLAEFKTETEDLYFISQVSGKKLTKYRYFIEIEDHGQTIGFVLLDLTQKRVVPNSVFPLLLNENLYDQQVEDAEQFSYGIFDNGVLQYNFGEFNYRKNLDALSDNSNTIFDRSVLINGYFHKAFEGENNKIVIVSAIQLPLGARFANFSFLFLIYVFSILLILIVITFAQAVQRVKLNYATKIQLYLNFAFFTPLIIISITTVSIIIQTFKSTLENQYLEYAQNLSSQLAEPLDALRNIEIDPAELSDITFQVAEIADLDVSLFHNGRLMASSLNQVYQNEILSGNIEPRAYIKIIEDKESAFVQEEQVGLLKYKNAYVSIRSFDTGGIIGIISLPFFASQRDLEENIMEVLSNIINIFTFIFVIFLFVSFFVSRGLTFPLQLFTQKLRRTSLASYNEPLSWNSDDEIGLMVAEYNRMLINLEESKRALAKSEKESAWREMARQVAHEIKNPLTPMKLTLQHMKRVLVDESSDNMDERKMGQINNLLEQIEVLSDIATSFSDFAKMPTPKMEKLDLRQLLCETVELYNKKELGEIVTNLEEGQFIIDGDRKWLGRALSNLIINGFQAVNNPEEAKIEINLSANSEGMLQVEIRDNGIGIPTHIQDKVFTPNFSTKYTGSGLGLAITKRGIEHANGKIWFESVEGAGTTFYIEIPRG